MIGLLVMLKIAKFVGANTDFSTAQAFIFPRIYLEGSTEAVFGLVISGEGEDVFIKVKQKILDLEEDFAAPFDRLTDKLHELLERLKQEFRGLENLKITLFSAKENLFYVLQYGNNVVEILRDGNRASVIPGELPQEKIISGFLKPGDKILVLSAKGNDDRWSQDAISQSFNLPIENIQDAEVIFAQNEQKVEQSDELSGIKQIIPVAFILIENKQSLPSGQIPGEKKTEIPDISASTKPAFNLPKPQLKINFSFGSVALIFRKIIRQGFGVLRQINKKLLIALILIFLITVISTGGYLYYQARQRARNARVDNLIILISDNLNQARALKETDLKSAQDQISKARAQLKELEGLDPKNPRVVETKNNTDNAIAEILRIYKNFDLTLFLSLDLIKQNFHTQRLSFSVNKILLLDGAEKSLVSINTTDKTPDIIAGRQQLGDAQIASINGSDAFVYSSDKGIVHIDLDNNKASVVSAPDEGWGQIKDIFGFSGNVYALDVGKNMLWKYAPTQSGYSQKQAYLKSDVNLSFGKKMVIDYSVWVLTGEPDVLRFTAGNSDFYAISGVDQPVTQIDGIYVPEELDSVFLLDKLNSRILVTKKSGEYLAQYEKPEFSKVDDFFVDEEGKLIYLLIENKIYTTPLR